MSSDDEMVDVSAPAVRDGRDTPANEASNLSRGPDHPNHKIQPTSRKTPDNARIQKNVSVTSGVDDTGGGSISSTNSAKTRPRGSFSDTLGSNDRMNSIRKLGSVTPALSPSKANPVRSVKFEKDVARLQEVVVDVPPEVAQHVLHENWRDFIFKNYDATHISFILRAILKNANTDVLERVVKEGGLFKGDILEAAISNKVVINSVVSDPDNIPLLAKNMSAEEIIGALPESDVDRLVLARMKTLESQQLVDMLATSGRLGFGETDEVEGEVVTPKYEDPLPDNISNAAVAAIAAIVVARRAQQSAALGRSPQLAVAGDAPEMRCHKCGKGPFWHKSGFNYHVSKGNCDKPPPATGWKWMCDFCMQGFTTKQGREYHNLKHVCENCDIEPATLPTGGLTLTLGNPQPQPGEPGARPPMVAARPPQLRASSSSSTVSQAPPLQNSVVSQTGSLQSSPAPSASIQRPPMRTPAPIADPPRQSTSKTPSAAASASTPNARKTQVGDPDIRQSPSELAPDKKAALDQEIADENAKYESQRQEVLQLPPGEDREHRLTQLKNGNASKKSGIRKRYGVTLRMRDKDKAAMGMRKSSSTPSKLRESLSANPEISMLPPPPANGFSAINTIVPVSTRFSPVNGQSRHSKVPESQMNAQPPSRPYGSPYGNGAAVLLNGHPSPYPPPGMSPYTQPGQSPYGSPPTQTPVGTYVSQYGPDTGKLKRQRSNSSTGDEGAARPSPGPGAGGYRTPYASVESSNPPTPNGHLEMKEHSSQISNTKMSNYIAGPQAKWQAMRPSQSAFNSPAGSAPVSPAPEKDSGRDVDMNDAPTGTSTRISKSDVRFITETQTATKVNEKVKDKELKKGKGKNMDKGGQNVIIALDDSDDSDWGSIINENV